MRSKTTTATGNTKRALDRIAFLDSTYNPATMPAFDIWYDSSRMYLQAQPQIPMRMFMDRC